MTSTARVVDKRTPNCVQVNPSLDSKKESGATISHSRIEPKYMEYHCLITKI
jgi:Pyruvate/2-oxoacid:ferredoxin oxidoreductase gamma subunit